MGAGNVAKPGSWAGWGSQGGQTGSNIVRVWVLSQPHWDAAGKKLEKGTFVEIAKMLMI